MATITGLKASARLHANNKLRAITTKSGAGSTSVESSPTSTTSICNDSFHAQLSSPFIIALCHRQDSRKECLAEGDSISSNADDYLLEGSPVDLDAMLDLFGGASKDALHIPKQYEYHVTDYDKPENSICGAVLVLGDETAEVDDTSSVSSVYLDEFYTIEPHDKRRMSELAHAIAEKQSDIALLFCSTVKRMGETMVDSENYVNKSHVRQRESTCNELHRKAIQMANQQAHLAHQMTKLVLRLEHNLSVLEAAYEDLMKSKLTDIPPSDVYVNEAPTSILDYFTMEPFHIKEISFLNPAVVVDVNELADDEEAFSFYTRTTNPSQSHVIDHEDAHLRLIL